MRKKTKRLGTILGVAVGVSLLCAACDTRIKTVTYVMESEKLHGSIRLAVVADLHSCAYGEGMEDLITAVLETGADALLLPGDFFDDKLPMENTRIFARAIAAELPTFYVSGNHELGSGRAKEMKEELRTLGITVLEGESVPLTVRGDTVMIGDADDVTFGREIAREQLQRAREQAGEEFFSVLLSHRPDQAEFYDTLGFDAVICGHAHGGQWRIPGILNGLYAPHQGPFPEYAGGRYDLSHTTMIVSRGLARETTPVPRIFNRPELVVVEVFGTRGE